MYPYLTYELIFYPACANLKFRFNFTKYNNIYSRILKIE